MPKPTSIIKNNDYKAWVHSLKAQIQSAQIKAAVSVNKELLKLYWLLGSQIVEKQQASVWGDGFIKQLSHDLRQEFPDIKGFSVRNLELIRKWFLYWHEVETIAKQVVAQLDDVPVLQIPWGQNLVIISKSKSTEEAQFYVSAVDDLLESEQDQPTIGMLICKSSHQTIVEYALKDMHKPIGVSEYELTRHLPDTFKSSLPSIEEIEAELEVRNE